ncbi:MAG: heme utilization cystosolic carrier protein HutX [Plesiomonas sp.]|uniref:heme utilization cystosolic carrier protein HutX n=1 Tax=Plesiomonas sp. TaxID=2486279 RepID=UPI003F2D8147
MLEQSTLEQSMIKQQDLATQIAALSEQELGASTQALANQFSVSEQQLVAALPAAMSTWIPAEHAQTLLESLTEWGALTTIIESEGSIFEFKGAFPAGKPAHGYFNLYTKSAEGLHGHLKLDQVAHIALLEKPFMGKESYSLLFFAQSGRCIFKVYLGRDSKRQLFPEQISRFNQLREQYALSSVVSVSEPA